MLTLVLSISASIYYLLHNNRRQRMEGVYASEPPQVITAVAPVFIPFILGKTGVLRATVKVTINQVGEVSEAELVESSPLKDLSFVETARKWRFNALSTDSQHRTAMIKYVLRIMPKDTPLNELTTIYSFPYEIEVRHEVFDMPTNSDPYFNKKSSTKKRKPALE